MKDAVLIFCAQCAYGVFAVALVVFGLPLLLVLGAIVWLVGLIWSVLER